MGMVANSVARVERLERTVIDDRRAVVRSAERLKADARSFLSRADVQICLFATGLLVGAGGSNLRRGLVRVGAFFAWSLRNGAP